MDERDPQRLLDERLRSAIWKKQRITLIFTAVLSLLFFGLVLLVGFAPSLLSVRLMDGGVISVYIVVSAALIVLVCVLMNLFVAIKLRDSHEDLRELVKSRGRPGS